MLHLQRAHKPLISGRKSHLINICDINQGREQFHFYSPPKMSWNLRKCITLLLCLG